MAKLHSEIRIKSVSGIGGGSEGDPIKFEDGAVVYDAAANVYRKKNGAIGSGAWLPLNQSDIRGIKRLQYPHSDAIEDFIVTVAAKDATHRYDGGSTSGYKIDGVFAPLIQLVPGKTYKFKQEDGSNSGHRLRFYQNADKSGGAYTSGVTVAGTLGSSGAFTQIVVSDTTPQYLHYMCESHAYMGNAVVTSTGAGGTGSTDLGNTRSGSDFTITSSTGNNIALPLADTNNWGVMSDEMFDQLAALNSDAIVKTLADAKGDLFAASADNTVTRLAIGANTHVLTADSTEATGMKWAAAPSGRTIEVDTNGDGNANETLGASEALRIKQGPHMNITEAGGIVTFEGESQFGHWDKNFTGSSQNVHNDLEGKNGGFFIVEGGGIGSFGSYQIAASLGSITVPKATPKFEFFNKDPSKQWKFRKTNGTLKDYTSATTIGDGNDVEILANQYLTLWYTGSEWRYIVRSI